jgi:hypothetical protein
MQFHMHFFPSAWRKNPGSTLLVDNLNAELTWCGESVQARQGLFHQILVCLTKLNAHSKALYLGAKGRKSFTSFTRLSRVLAPGVLGLSICPATEDDFWDRYCMETPVRRKQLVEQFSIVKRAL